MTKPINTEDGKTKPSPRPPKGRPRTAKVKNHWISFRVTAEEHFALLDKAERSGMSAGEYARSRAMRGIVRAKAAAKTDELFGDRTRAVLHELRKQGVNLNQIAHHCNRHQIPPPPALAELITQLQELWRKVMR
jgi:hypothetical protein